MNGPAFPIRSGWQAPRRLSCMPFPSSSSSCVVAALYESWSIPISIMLVLPLGVFGAALATWSRGLPQRRLLPDRLPHHPRPDDKKRHPYHPVCKGADGPRRRADRGDPWGGAGAAAARHHDLTGFFLRRPAAGHRDRRGRRRDEGHRHRRDRRDAHGHIHRLFYIPLFFVLVSRMFKAKAAGSTAWAPRRSHHFFRGTPVMIRNALTIILAVICLAGCTMIPDVFTPGAAHPGRVADGSGLQGGRRRPDRSAGRRRRVARVLCR